MTSNVKNFKKLSDISKGIGERPKDNRHGNTNTGFFINDNTVDEKAYIEHLVDEKRELLKIAFGNDINKRMDYFDYPLSNRDFMLNYDYGKFLRQFYPKFDFNNYFLNNSWLFLHGEKGRGKTTLSLRLSWEWAKDDFAKKVSFHSIAEWLKRTQGLNREEKNKTGIDGMGKFVILDDFDKFQFNKRWQIINLFLLIDKLEKENHKVIITSNRSLGVIHKESDNDYDLGAALDRIKQNALQIKFEGKSFRNFLNRLISHD